MIAVAFAYNNWANVPVKLWSGLVADVNLPLLLLVTYLLGLVPMVLIFQASRWRWRQRLAMAERSLADAYRTPVAPEPPLAPVAGAGAGAPG